MLLAFGCQKEPTAAAKVAGAAALSPRQVVERLIEVRSRSAFQEMMPLIVAPRAGEIVTMLVAIQDFLAANHALCEHVRREIGLGLADAIDHRDLAYEMGIFSSYVRVLDEHIDGDTAIVTFTVDGRLPAREAELRRIGGRWQYDPGPGDFQQLSEAFNRMARGLRQVTEELQTGRLTTAEVRANPEKLFEEVRVRLMPGVKLLPQPPAEARGAAP